MNHLVLFAVCLVCAVVVTDACKRSCQTSAAVSNVKKAKAVFHAGTSIYAEKVSGIITFTALPNGATSITGTLSGLTAGEHGFHIHSSGDFTTCTSGGGHYNPFKKDHGGPKDTWRHVGDMGNIVGGSKTTVSLTDNLIKLSGPTSVIGRMVVIHKNPDDLGKGGNPGSLNKGNSGPRIACAIIGLV